MTDPETHDVRTDGDDLVVETPFGTARYSLKDANAPANDKLRSDTEQWPADFSLPERWRILFDEVDITVSEFVREEL